MILRHLQDNQCFMLLAIGRIDCKYSELIDIDSSNRVQL